MASKQMKTLTIDGTTYEIVDEVARNGIKNLTAEELIAQAVQDYLTKNPVTGSSTLRVTEITLLAENWIKKTNENNIYYQVVDIIGITEYSQVDLTPSIEQLAIFHNKDIAFVTENEDGVVTVYVIGDKPMNDYTMQVTIKEVVV